MPSCAAVPKPAVISWSTVIVSGMQVLAAGIPATLIVIAIVRDPFKELRTRMAIFILSSAGASLLSVPVNAMRVWIHYQNTTGINLLTGYKDVVVPLIACKITWFACLCLAALCLFAILVEQAFLEPSQNTSEERFSPGCKIATFFIWLVGLGTGMLYFLFGRPRMHKVTTMLYSVFSICGLVVAYCWIYRPAKRHLISVMLSEKKAVSEEKKSEIESQVDECPKKPDERSYGVTLPNQIMEIVQLEERVVRSSDVAAVVLTEAKTTLYSLLLHFICMNLSGKVDNF